MMRKFNFIIEGKLVEIYESNCETAKKLAYEVIEEMKRIGVEDDGK